MAPRCKLLPALSVHKPMALSVNSSHWSRSQCQAGSSYLAQRLLLPLGHLVAPQADAAQLLGQVALPLLGQGVLPRAAQVLGDGLQQRALQGKKRTSVQFLEGSNVCKHGPSGGLQQGALQGTLIAMAISLLP